MCAVRLRVSQLRIICSQSVHREGPRNKCYYMVPLYLRSTLTKLTTMKSNIMDLVKQNFHKDCEQAINNQINLELFSSYVYLSMAYYFDRCDVALPGHYMYFKKASDEEREHAMKFMTYQNKRGGSITLTPIENPPKDDWISAHDAMTEALKLERQVNESLLQIHALATRHNDPNLLDFLETEYLKEQVDSINELANHITKLERVGDGVGVHIFDQELRE